MGDDSVAGTHREGEDDERGFGPPLSVPSEKRRERPEPPTRSDGSGGSATAGYASPASARRAAEIGAVADSEAPEGGTVSLVGSGPGDPELLTRRAWNRLSNADVVLHDSLTGDEIIAELPETTEVVDVGKRPPDRTTQAEINELMCERARRDEHVVRLKGGDPNVFGRGGEEAEYLAGEDVAFEVVPGISSVLAAPSVAGFPLTHRDRSSSVTVITGHQTPEKAESALDWSALADTVTAGGTLVILMGVKRLAENVAALRDHGVPAETPVGMVQKATWADEELVLGTLDTIVEESRAAGVESPATTVVGDVVDVHGATEEQLRR